MKVSRQNVFFSPSIEEYSQKNALRRIEGLGCEEGQLSAESPDLTAVGLNANEGLQTLTIGAGYR